MEYIERAKERRRAALAAADSNPSLAEELHRLSQEVFERGAGGADPARCHECGETFRPDDAQAEAFILPEYVEAHGLPQLAGMASDNELQGPYILHAEPCFTGNRDKYALA